MIRDSIAKVVSGANLTPREARAAMLEMLSGEATEAQIGAFLTALSMKRETVEELAAFASVMKEFCHIIRPNVKGRMVDTCGTGGDGLKTFNVSTVAALVAAGAGVAVAKHGNRSVTSNSGSADVLEQLGLNLSQGPVEVQKAIESIGIGLMFAPGSTRQCAPCLRHDKRSACGRFSTFLDHLSIRRTPRRTFSASPSGRG